jgi:hypothetical protein
MAGQKESYNGIPSYKPIPKESVSIINGVSIKYTRDDRGCVDKCQFKSDPALCGKNGECCQSKDLSSKAKEDCLMSLEKSEKTEAGTFSCVDTEHPRIGKEKVVFADNTIDSTRECNEFRIVTHGSPGWLTTCSGSCTKACLGWYFEPYCCQYDPSHGWQCSTP